MECDLCKTEEFPFLLTICQICGIPLVVSTEHKTEFSEEEKKLIKKIFKNKKIRWTMRSIPDHAHCHIEGKRSS